MGGTGASLFKIPFNKTPPASLEKQRQAFTITVHILQCLSCLALWQTCFISTPKCTRLSQTNYTFFLHRRLLFLPLHLSVLHSSQNMNRIIFFFILKPLVLNRNWTL